MKHWITVAIIAVLNIATLAMCAYGAVLANRHRANHQFLDTWEHHADKPASAPKE